MTQTELNTILKKHITWLAGQDGGEKAILHDKDLRKMNLSCVVLRDADLRNTNLVGVNLSYSDLRRANMSGANMKNSDLSGADLNGAKLYETDLSGADLRCSDLNNANLSGTIGLTNSINYLSSHFESTNDGYIVYKSFGEEYKSPNKWAIKPNCIIEEEPNYNRTSICGCGINAATLNWVKTHYPNSDIYKLLIKWDWLPGVVVPYNTDGKIRCAKAQIIGMI